MQDELNSGSTWLMLRPNVNFSSNLFYKALLQEQIFANYNILWSQQK